jgi:hypothetical protein
VFVLVHVGRGCQACRSFGSGGHEFVDSLPVPSLGSLRWVFMTDVQVVGWIAARRAELDELETSLARQLAEVRAERDELAVAEEVWARAEAAVAAEVAPVPAEATSALVGGRSVLLIPHRSPGMGEDALPPEYRKIMGILRGAAGPVMAKAVGEKLGIDVNSPGKVEPLRGKLTKLAERGWARKLPDGRFQITP